MDKCVYHNILFKCWHSSLVSPFQMQCSAETKARLLRVHLQSLLYLLTYSFHYSFVPNHHHRVTWCTSFHSGEEYLHISWCCFHFSSLKFNWWFLSPSRTDGHDKDVITKYTLCWWCSVSGRWNEGTRCCSSSFLPRTILHLIPFCRDRVSQEVLSCPQNFHITARRRRRRHQPATTQRVQHW